MKLHMWCAALVVVGAAARPSSLAAQDRSVQPYSYVVVSFTGQHQGRFPAANCSPPALQGLAGVADFAETTPANVPAGFGSFDVQLGAACATPFFQALFAREPMTVVATFVSADGTPTMTYSMKSAQLTHVTLSTISAGAALVPYLKLSIAAPQVVVAAGGGSPSVSDPAPSSGPSSSTALRRRKANSSSLKRVRAPTLHVPLDQLRRVRPIRISGAAAASAPPAAPSGVGSSWLGSGPRGGVGGALRLTAQFSNFDLNIASVLVLNAGYAIDASSHMPAGGLQVSLDPLQLVTDASTMTALGNAARAHAELSPGVLVIRDMAASPCITITLHGGRFVSYQVAASNGVTIQTVQLGLDGFTITDIGSGKSAQSQP